MQKFNYPTTIYYGEGSIEAAAKEMVARRHKRPLFVTDATLTKLGIAKKVIDVLEAQSLKTVLFDEVHPNPIEEDVWAGAKIYKENDCDSIFSLGGGSPNDTAKVIAIAATHDRPLEDFEDCKGGDANVVNPLPAIYSAATTAGTGSEVGRSGLVTLKSTGLKTIIFHPDLLPKIAILEPSLTVGLPKMVTATTGVDAFSHNFEAYMASGFHPMADGIALEGIKLVLENLPKVIDNPEDLEARAKMLLASAMGSTAFQKGLGGAHSMANALTTKYQTHHGTAIALSLPATVKFLENADLSEEQAKRIDAIQTLFSNAGFKKPTLSESIRHFCEEMGIPMGLDKHDIDDSQFEEMSQIAFEDPTHGGNMIPLKKDNFLWMFQQAAK